MQKRHHADVYCTYKITRTMHDRTRLSQQFSSARSGRLGTQCGMLLTRGILFRECSEQLSFKYFPKM